MTSSIGGTDRRLGGSVLVVGSVNRDVTVRTSRFPAPGETVTGESVAYGLGGKGANQAVAAARAGVSVQLLATVGDDDPGRALRAELERLGVGTALVRASTGRATGSAHITVDASGQNHIVVVPGANAETGPAQVHDARDALGRAAVVIVQTEIPEPTVTALVDLAHGTPARVVLNLAPVIRLPDPVLAGADVLVVNEHEASALLGGPAPVTVAAAGEAARLLLRRTPAVVVTLGPQGAVWASRDGAGGHVEAPGAARVVDTTGAGDALVGVLGAALAAGASLGGAVRDAVTAATRSVELPGAGGSYPRFALAHPG